MKLSVGSLERGGICNKCEGLWAKHCERTPKATWMSLTLGMFLHVAHPCPKNLEKRKR